MQTSHKLQPRPHMLRQPTVRRAQANAPSRDSSKESIKRDYLDGAMGGGNPLPASLLPRKEISRLLNKLKGLQEVDRNHCLKRRFEGVINASLSRGYVESSRLDELVLTLDRRSVLTKIPGYKPQISIKAKPLNTSSPSSQLPKVFLSLNKITQNSAELMSDGKNSYGKRHFLARKHSLDNSCSDRESVTKSVDRLYSEIVGQRAKTQEVNHIKIEEFNRTYDRPRLLMHSLGRSQAHVHDRKNSQESTASGFGGRHGRLGSQSMEAVHHSKNNLPQRSIQASSGNAEGSSLAAQQRQNLANKARYGPFTPQQPGYPKLRTNLDNSRASPSRRMVQTPTPPLTLSSWRRVNSGDDALFQF